ncbi:MAG TPA: aromatic amino acid transport family protein, partial [Candidatus Paceibacterota bacterium]
MARYAKGIGILVGMIFGAGIFALPYAFASAGLFWGLMDFALAFIIILITHYFYAEVSYFVKGRHRFTSHAEILIGKKAKAISLVTTIFTYYGSLLAYGLLGGIFLSNFFGGRGKGVATITFLLAAGLLSLFRLNKIAKVNFYIVLLMLGFLVYLFSLALPHVNVATFSQNFTIFSPSWFLPFGIGVFALGGYSAIPEVRDIFLGSSFRKMKRVILISSVIIAVSYLLFVFSVWGVSGKQTSKDALSGLRAFLGAKAVIMGSLVGLLA